MSDTIQERREFGGADETPDPVELVIEAALRGQFDEAARIAGVWDDDDGWPQGVLVIDEPGQLVLVGDECRGASSSLVVKPGGSPRLTAQEWRQPDDEDDGADPVLSRLWVIDTVAEAAAWVWGWP